jgi:uncharacterized protein YxjI
MAFKPEPGEKYTIRRQVLKFFGAGFHIYDEQAKVIGYFKQKAFKLREDLRLYPSDACTEELLRIGTQQVIDFGATYTVTLPAGQVIGSFRRKGMKSSFIRDEWVVLSPDGREIATVLEDSSMLALLRRYVDYVSIFFPQKFHMKTGDGRELALFRQHFNPFVYRLGIKPTELGNAQDDDLDDLMILAAGVLMASIEGRE